MLLYLCCCVDVEGGWVYLPRWAQHPPASSQPSASSGPPSWPTGTAGVMSGSNLGSGSSVSLVLFACPEAPVVHPTPQRCPAYEPRVLNDSESCHTTVTVVSDQTLVFVHVSVTVSSIDAPPEEGLSECVRLLQKHSPGLYEPQIWPSTANSWRWTHPGPAPSCRVAAVTFGESKPSFCVCLMCVAWLYKQW